MKRSIKIAVAAAIALSSTSAFATNGDHLIGTGAKARGMGGIGIGMAHGAESALSNPAMITSVKGTEVSFGGTIFMPDVESKVKAVDGTSYKSDADLSVIPEVSIASKVNDNFYWGVGMFGTAGMGVDYRNAPDNTTTHAHGNYNMVSNLQLMQFAVPLAYRTGGLSIGFAPVLQYGSLDMNYKMYNTGNSTEYAFGQGVAQDLGMGFNAGAAYTMSGLTLGASYKSAIDMEYKKMLNSTTGAAALFQVSGISDHLEQPAEMGIGASYKIGAHTIAVDYKKIKWSDAKGYKEFLWDDQNVYMIGYEFADKNWALRAGYNYGKSPIKDRGAANTAINTLNLLGFPATVESHYTVGGSYALNNTTSLDLAYVHAKEKTDTVNSGMNGYEVTTKHSQDSISMQVNFNF